MIEAWIVWGRDDVAFAFVGEGAVKPRLEARRENGLSNVSFIPYQPKDDSSTA
ncbi:MAG: hypothetical protein ACLTMP_13180 [Eggerthella lenta]